MLAIDRRSFLRATAALCAGARLDWRSGPMLRIGILSTGDDARARHDGALLGVEEAKHAAELFGGGAELVGVPDPASVPRSVAAVIGNDSLSAGQALTRRAGDGSVLFMNVSCAADELRGSACSSFAFHVCPSAAMMRDARAQAPGATDVVAWDGSLVRFGADTLNDRYRKRFGRSMTPASWAAWFAVKALWESSLRTKSAEPRRIADYLVRDATQFDGHKGRPLSFRSWDHQLRQFVYARIDGKLVEVPQGARPQTTSRDLLDKLGVSASASPCRFGS
jgi:hypothetical protein